MIFKTALSLAVLEASLMFLIGCSSEDDALEQALNSITAADGC